MARIMAYRVGDGALIYDRRRVELGVYTFAELTPEVEGGPIVGAAQRLRDLIEEIELADQVGLDVFGVGEHHRPDFAVSAPAVALAAAAERTERIRLTSAVSVISSDDPVRVFQDFATLDLLSGGRAEIMAGRGSFIESFPLFGYDLDDYDELFAEKLELLLAVRASTEVSWDGRLRRADRPAAASTRGRCRTRCRSGSRSAARPSRRSAPAGSGCRWRWRSSAANRPASSPSPSCTPPRRPRPAHRRPALSINSHGFVAADLAGRPPTSPSRPSPG